MNDLELYIYIALALIYFLSRAFRSKKPQGPPRQSGKRQPVTDNEQSSSGEKSVTFEDLLKEFMGQKEEEIPAVPEEIISDEISGEKKAHDLTESYAEPTYPTYEETAYKSYEEVYSNTGDLKTLDEQVSLNLPGRKRFDKYKIQEQENIHAASRFREILQNRNSVKDAIILKEILDRKYF